MQKVQLIYNEESKGEYKRVFELSNRLSTLAENCEIWYTNTRTTELTKFEDIIYNLLNSLGRPGEVDEEGHDSRYGKNIDEPESEILPWNKAHGDSENGDDGNFDPTKVVKANMELVGTMVSFESDLPDKFGQDLYRNVAIFDALYEFVFYDLESNNVEVTKANKGLLTSIYYFMAKLCKDNEENQILVTNLALKTVILPHIMLIVEGLDFQCYLLLRELVKENKHIIMDADKMENIVNS
jgi:hypothetical protein